jgi:IclR family acetate operon transcriptional repressor
MARVRAARSDAAPSDADVTAAPAASRSSVQSVTRAFTLLDILKDSSVAMSALEVARASGLDRTVVHRLLRTLAGTGMVVEERGSYRLGPASVLLANRYLDNLLVRRLALPYLLELQGNAVGEKPWPVTLLIPVGPVVTVVERIWTRSVPLDMVLDIGDTFPIDLAAAGRVLLAYREEDQARTLIGDERYEAVAPTLERVREVGGVGLSRGEAIPGINAMAAAIRSRRGHAVGAIAVSGVDLGDQLSDESMLAGQLLRSARAVGQSLP